MVSAKIGFALVLALGSIAECYAWPVTEVYVKVSQDDQGNFTTSTDRPDLWTGPDATWIRGRKQDITYIDAQGHITYGSWPEGRIVRMGRLHEYDTPTRRYDSFYGLAPMGADAYFMRTGIGWNNPTSKVYVGTNFFSGTLVKDIVTLQYTAQLTYRGHPDTVDGFTLWGQPPMVELNTDTDATHPQQRVFWCKPWGANALQTSPQGNTWEKRWHDLDCTAGGGFWLQGQTSSADCHGDWQWLRGKYPNKALRAPLEGDYTQGYEGLMLHNPSATSLSIELGAHQVSSNLNGYNYQESWILEAEDNWSFFDKVVVGVATGWDTNTPPLPTGEIRYTFDFENSTEPVPTLAAIGNAPRKLAIVQGMEDSYLFVVYGRLITTPDYADNGYVAGELFTIDDGSGAPVRVICPGHMVPAPQGWYDPFVRVEGRLFNLQAVDPRFSYLPPDSVYRQIHEHTIYSQPDLVTLYSTMPE